MTRRNRRTGFTIVEMLVVIGVITVLMGLLLPALSGAQKRGRKTEELNRLRQIGIAWNLYAQSNRDAAVPGYLEGVQQGPESLTVQDAWKVRYRDSVGGTVSPDDAEEWPWRLLQYMEYDQNVVLGYLDLDDTSPQAMSDDSLRDPVPHRGAGATIPRPQHVAEEPGFGYNGFYVGGYWDQWTELLEDVDGEEEVVGHIPRARFSNSIMLDENGAPVTWDSKSGGTYKSTANVVTRSAASIRNTSRLILFCSSSLLPAGEFHEVDDTRFGSHLVVPPYLADEKMWQRGPSDSILNVTGTLDGANAPVPIGRYTGSPAMIFADLHAESTAPGALDDQRKWIDAADRELWVHSGP